MLWIGRQLAGHVLPRLSRQAHAKPQFRRTKAQTERTIVGVHAFPGWAPRSLGLLVETAGFLRLRPHDPQLHGRAEPGEEPPGEPGAVES